MRIAQATQFPEQGRKETPGTWSHLVRGGEGMDRGRGHALAVPEPIVRSPGIVSLAQCPVSRFVEALLFQDA
eukprot:12322606-Prorocentrum_lima.AAC.1